MNKNLDILPKNTNKNGFYCMSETTKKKGTTKKKETAKKKGTTKKKETKKKKSTTFKDARLNKIITLDLEGEQYEITKGTLIRSETYFSKELDGELTKNAIFIDRNKTHFKRIMDYLRTLDPYSLLHNLEASEMKILNFELEFYRIPYRIQLAREGSKRESSGMCVVSIEPVDGNQLMLHMSPCIPNVVVFSDFSDINYSVDILDIRHKRMRLEDAVKEQYMLWTIDEQTATFKRGERDFQQKDPGVYRIVNINDNKPDFKFIKDGESWGFDLAELGSAMKNEKIYVDMIYLIPENETCVFSKDF
jgi:hypothetical protein